MEWIHLLVLILVLAACYTIGFATRNYIEKKDMKAGKMGTVEGSLLALFAFFLGFTFSISASKVEEVRKTSIAESNAIGTALLRTQLYSEEDEAHFIDLFKTYLKDRIDYFNASMQENSQEELTMSNDAGNKIWAYAVELEKSKKYAEESRLMLPAINDMIDAVSTRDSAINANLPKMIIYTLYVLCLCSAFLIGFSMQKKIYNNFVGVIYILIVALTVNLILDAADPREGFINTKKANQGIVEIYNSLE